MFFARRACCFSLAKSAKEKGKINVCACLRTSAVKKNKEIGEREPFRYENQGWIDIAEPFMY